MTTEERRASWRRTIENQVTSGMDVATYCREHHIGTSLFYTWRRKLREQQFCATGFTELTTVRSPGADTCIRVRLSAKLCIEVDRGFDPFTLRAVVEALCRTDVRPDRGNPHLSLPWCLRYAQVLRRPLRHRSFRPGSGPPVRFSFRLRQPASQHGETSLLGPGRPGTLV